MNDVSSINFASAAPVTASQRISVDPRNGPRNAQLP